MKRIIKINPKAPEPDLIAEAAQTILQGDVIGYPTETIYGLGANAFNNSAVDNVFELKGRDKNKPILVIAGNIEQVKELTTSFDNTAAILARLFWPGPLTMVFKAAPHLSPAITGEKGTVGIRIPDNRICLELIEKSGVPITSTSANLSGQENPVTAEQVAESFGSRLNLIIDGGRSISSVPSTVISVIDNEIKLFREGVISKSEIANKTGNNIYEK